MPELTEPVANLDDVLADEADSSEQDASADYGKNNEDLPDELKLALLSLAKFFVKQDTTPRRDEVYEAWLQRLYWRGLQYIYWSNDDQCFQVASNGANSGSGNKSTEVDMPKYTSVYNIYYRYMSSLISVLTQNAPGVRFEPKCSTSQQDITTAQKALQFQRVIERNNDMKKLQADIARLFCTDGRVAIHTEYIEDGEQFGYEDQPHVDEKSQDLDADEADERDPKGQEVFHAYGVLEVKVPILLNDFSRFPYLLLSTEEDITMAKSMFEDLADSIQEGASSLGESAYSRQARLNVLQGSNERSLSGESYSHMVTIHKLWLRPCAFTQAPEDIREELQELFPDGAYVCFVGDKYAESRNESMDDHWAVQSALPADGQFSPSLGRPLIDIQDCYNDLMNLRQEIYDYSIPSMWMDTELGDIDAIREQVSQPGARIPAKRRPNEPMEASFYMEPFVSVPEDMLMALEDLRGQLAQFITGALPALFGGQMEGNDTASGYAMARDQAMGQMGLTWSALQTLWSKMMKQAVRCAAYHRLSDIEVPSTAGQQDSSIITLEDLKGEMLCFPEADSSFPDTFSARRNVYMQLMTGATSNPVLAQVMNEPNNLALGKDLIGLPDLIIPGEESRNKQRRELDQLLKETPIPDEQALHMEAVDLTVAKVTGQPPPAPPQPEDVLQPSIPIDPIFDNHQYEFAEVQYWLNSKEGDDARLKNPKGWMNVRLHGLAHFNEMQKQQAQAAQQASAASGKGAPAPAGPKPPAEAIAFKDMPPSGQIQMAQQAGIQLTPADVGQPPPAQTTPPPM